MLQLDTDLNLFESFLDQVVVLRVEPLEVRKVVLRLRVTPGTHIPSGQCQLNADTIDVVESERNRNVSPWRIVTSSTTMFLGREMAEVKVAALYGTLDLHTYSSIPSASAWRMPTHLP